MSEQMWHIIKRVLLVDTFLPLAAVLALPTLAIQLPLMILRVIYDLRAEKIPKWLVTTQAYIWAPLYISIVIGTGTQRLFRCSGLYQRSLPKKLKLVDRMLAVAEDGTCPNYTIPSQENLMLCLLLRLASAELDA